MQKFPPERIVCLSAETIETIYLLGEEKRIVGVTGYASRPKIVRIEKARVSSFTGARTNEILRLNPDLVFTFSDVQADLSRDLVSAGLNVFCFNQRSVAGILSMISMIGAILNCTEKADNLKGEFIKNITFCKENKPSYQPKVYFEEWNEPMIAGIGWVSEIIAIAGGIDVFAAKAGYPKSEDRTVFLDEVIQEKVQDYFSRMHKRELTDIDYIKEISLDFCRKQNLKEAMMTSVGLLQNCSFDEISKVINEALKLGSENNFGYDYMADFEERFMPKFRNTITTGWGDVDGITGGGLGKSELGLPSTVSTSLNLIFFLTIKSFLPLPFILPFLLLFYFRL